MPKVLTTNAIILCPHLGKGTSTPLSPVWKVDGGYVLAEGDTGVLACPFLPLPCAGYTLRSMGLNATKIQGRKVIVVTDFNQSITGLPLTMTESHTTVDSSTPAPLPPRGPAPPLPPAILDLVPPVVTATMPVGTFSVSTGPPSVVATFQLSSAFPRQWVLTRISEPPPGSHEDLTPGKPPGAVVAPAGGSWTTPSLTVTLTMTAVYMTALGIGKHHFYLTGVSQRGLSGYGVADLEVVA
jgi:hypothetical protein